MCNRALYYLSTFLIGCLCTYLILVTDATVPWVKKYEADRHHAVAFKSCNCQHLTCGCCSHLEQHEIHLNSTICSNVTYLSEDYGISFTVTLDHYTLFNETVSARNPPPVCAGAPYVTDLADVCLRLTDIQATRRSLHACAEVEARLKHIRVADYHLGCFNIGNKTEIEDMLDMTSSNDTDPYVVLV